MAITRMCPNCGSDEFDGSVCSKCGKVADAGSGSRKKKFSGEALSEDELRKLREVQERVLLGGRV